MKPVIGIPQMGNDLFRKYMKSKYTASLKRAGAQVRWIDLEDVEAAVAAALECDGLLFPGGADIDPHLYGQEPTEKCGKPHILRDAAEPRLLRAYLPTEKPIFCICRGHQLLNVYFGGTLHQDIAPIQQCAHSDFKGKNRGSHPLRIQPGTKLHQILGCEETSVNSLHHQAVENVAQGLTVSAVSSDGFVEALEAAGHPFCLSVQWHPEHMSKCNPAQQRLFDAFVAACGK